MNKSEAAIFVDSEVYLSSVSVRAALKYKTMRNPHIKVVVLVTDVTSTGVGVPEDYILVRNTGNKSDLAFKQHAVGVLNDISNLILVYGIDCSQDVLDMYDREGFVTTDLVSVYA